MKSHLKQRIRNFFADPNQRPANKSELARILELSPDERPKLRKTLRVLHDAGEITMGKKGRYSPAPKPGSSLIEGTLFFPKNNRPSAAFFRPDDPKQLPGLSKDEDSVPIPIRYTQTAMHGDRVAARLKTGRPSPEGKGPKRGKKRPPRQREKDSTPQLKIEKVLERKQQRIVGIYRRSGKFHQLIPDLPQLPERFNLSQVLDQARPGQKVVAEFVSWDSHRTPPRAKMVKVLGSPDDPRVDLLAVIYKHQLPLEFPGEVMREAESVPSEVAASEIDAHREDWRQRDVFTIDPFDARDFDDAICITPLENQHWELAVHIADVSHYVAPNSALDREAKARGNSVYLADRVIPMLPEKLSNGICSLRPNEDRMTFACIMRFDNKGRMVDARFTPAIICSKRRYTYEEAFARLNLTEREISALPEAEAHMAKQVHLAWRLASKVRKRRFRKGALDLDFPETRVVLDDEGYAVDVKKVENDISHQLIEEFMLAANEAVARVTRESAIPSIYRIHEDPDPEKLLNFREEAKSFGYAIGDLTQRTELQKLLREIKGTQEEHALKIGLLRSLKRAAYSQDPIGHYGLAKRNYTHFTSPIRRHADLVVHRVMRRHLAKQSQDPSHPDLNLPTPGQAKITRIADHISQTERGRPRSRAGVTETQAHGIPHAPGPREFRSDF